jgi:phosphodiesterase/alkaline phosphatase D-like protein
MAAGLSLNPMLGAVTDSSINVWLRSDSTATAVVQYQLAGGNWSQPAQSAAVALIGPNDFSGVLSLTGLFQSTAYDYRVLLDGVVQPNGSSSFRTLPSRGIGSQFSFAFGADLNQNFRPHSIFNRISGQQPNFTLLLGDTIYYDLAFDPTVVSGAEANFWSLYRLNRDASFQAFANHTPILSIWDDHDYGADDSNALNPLKNAARAAFGKYWPNPTYVEQNASIYYKFAAGDTDFFMLDSRWNRTPSVTMLGPVQLQWLKDQLLGSSARFKFIVSPDMVSDFPSTGNDAWIGYPGERADLFQFIAANNIKNVIFLSGDQHWSGAFLINYPVYQIGNGVQGYYEVTATPLNAARRVAPRPNDPQVLFEDDRDLYYGLGRIDTTRFPARVQLEIHRASDDVAVYSISIDEFTPMAAPVIVTAALPQASFNIPYSQTLQASGGVGPYQWSTNGGLPAGLNLSPSGVISGTPVQTGTFLFTVNLQDSQGRVAGRAFSLLSSGTSLTATPGSVLQGTAVTATWSGIPSATAKDWIGLYAAGAANGSYVAWDYVNCTRISSVAVASGSCPIGVPGPLPNGVYELRVFANDGFTRLATSNPFNVGPVVLPTVTVAVTDGIATEGNPSDPAIFTINRTGSTAPPLIVNYTVGGSAANGFDYQGLSGTVLIPAGQSSANVTVTTLDDSFVEGNETVVLTLNSNTAYNLGSPVSGTITIIDNDSSGGASLTESPLSAAPGSAVTAAWSGIASPTGTDWVGLYVPGAPESNFLSWAYVNCTRFPGSPAPSGSCSLPLGTVPNGTYELRLFTNDGFVRLATSNQFGVGTVTLPTVTVTATDGIATEGNPADTGTFVISRTGATGTALTVNYTMGGTAGNGTDYQQLSGTAVIPAGQTSANITVNTIDDAAVEGNETVVLTLSQNAAYSVGSPGSATLLIVDNESPSTFLSVSPPSVTRGGSVTAAWGGIAPATSTDWLGVYALGAGDGSYYNWVYVSCTRVASVAMSSGACPLTVPISAPSGNYELRLFSRDGFNRLATSNPFTAN